MLLSASAIALAALITTTPRQARAECLPDPAANNDTVICASNDLDGFTSSAVNLTFIVNSGIFVGAAATGPAVSLSGTGAVITNNGFIEPVLDGASGFSLLANNMTLTNAAGAEIITGGNDAHGVFYIGNNLTLTNNGLIATSGDFSNGLNLGGNNLMITNNDRIGVTGLSSAGIFLTSVTGSTLTNSLTGVIEASGEASHVLRALLSDDLTIINNGSITAIRLSLTASDLVGLDLDTVTNSTATNFGTITVSGVVGAQIGMASSDGLLNVLTNSGTIVVTGDITSGMLVAQSTDSLINNGLITVSGNTAFGMQLIEGLSGLNSGTIIAGGVDATGISIIESATGSGVTFTNSGDVILTGTGTLIGVELTTADTISLINSGTIDATGGFALRSDGGVLTIANSGSLVGDLLFTNAAVDLTQSGGSITGNILFGTGDDELRITGGSITGDIDGGADLDTLTLDIAGPFDLGNVSNFESLTKSGLGTLTLSGSVDVAKATLSAGPTILNGTLIADTTVSAGASLVGTGTVSGNLLNLGSLAPGGSIGTTTITGNYTQGPGGTLFIEIAADGSSDLLAISGTASLDGTLDITALDGPITVGTSYTILTAAGGISGSFATLDQTLVMAPLALPVLTIGPNSVTFAINVASFTTAPLNPNQTGVALALDQFSNDSVGGIAGDYINDLVGSPLASIGGLLDPLVSEAAADFPSVIFAGRSAFLRTVGAASPHRVKEGRWSLWASGYGVLGNTDASLVASGYDHRYAGLVVGAMFAVGGKARAGMSLGVAGSDLDVDNQPGKNRHTSVDLAFHTGWSFEALEITTVAAVSFEDFETQRTIASPRVLAAARGDAKGTGFSALIKASYMIERGAFTFFPTANFEVINLRRQNYDEIGAGNLGLSVARSDLTSARLELGGTVSVRSWEPDVGLYAGAFWSHEFGDRERDIFATFLADPTASFIFSGVMADKHAFRATAGFRLEIGANSHLAVAYDGLIGARQQTHSITARFITSW